MKVGDKVIRENEPKLDGIVGVIARVAKGHIVVKWNGLHGDWYYTDDQAKSIKVVNEAG